MTKKQVKLIPKVTSLMDLRNKAKTDDRYLRLAIVAADNLGEKCSTLEQAMRWLNTNADETDEDGVVGEINFCRDLIDTLAPAPAPTPKPKPGIVNIDLLRDPILSTWSVIASDAMELGDMTNAGAIEMCIDADRMTFYASGVKGKTAAGDAEKELDRAIKAHGYKKVLNSLSRSIRLL